MPGPARDVSGRRAGQQDRPNRGHPTADDWIGRAEADPSEEDDDAQREQQPVGYDERREGQQNDAEQRTADPHEGQVLRGFAGREEDDVGGEEDPERIATAVALEEEHENRQRYRAPNAVARMLVEAP